MFEETNDGQLSGSLELGCYASSAPLLVPPVIRSFADKHPNVEIGLHEGNLEQVAMFLKDGTADLALTYDIYLDNDIEYDVIAPLAPFVVMSATNPLDRRMKLSLKDLVDEPLILLDSPVFR